MVFAADRASMIAARFVVRGRVQGVAFRACTRDQALRLGLVGSAKNRADGSVEVFAAGDAESVNALAEWLWEGSPMARVESVDCRPAELPDPLPTSFAIGRG